jgi:O-antigen ligase
MSLISTQVIKFETLIKWIVRIGMILLIAGVGQLIFLPDFTMLRDFGYDPHRFRLASTFLDPNFCGLVLLSIGWWSFWMSRQLKNRFYLIVSIALFIGVIMTLSRTAYLAGLISAILIGWRLWRWKVIVGVLVALVIGLMIPSVQVRLIGAFKMDVSASERLESWRNGVIVWQQSPILGVGYGNLRSAMTELNLRKSYSADGGNAGAVECVSNW